MEQPDKTLSDAIAQMERQLATCRDSTSCNLPMSVMLTVAKILADERDSRRALVRMVDDESEARQTLARLSEHRDQLAQQTNQRLTGEIAERSQRQLEITGRLAALERRMDSVDGGPGVRPSDAEALDATGPDKARKQVAAEIERARDYTDELTEALGYVRGSIVWHRALDLVRETIMQRKGAREQVAKQATANTQLTNRVRVLDDRNSTQAKTIAELELDIANARADAQIHQGARQALEAWAEQVRTALGAHPHESRPWMAAEISRRTRDVATYRQRWETQAATIGNQSGKIRDLEAQVHVLDHAIADVWALVEYTDGYGSPYWTEPGLDDTTLAEAVEAVLEHLRDVAWTARNAVMRAPAYPEAMAVLNAADRQSDDDQVCGC